MSDLRTALASAFAAAIFALTLQKVVEAYVGLQGRRLRHLAALHQIELTMNRFYNASISWKKQLERFQDETSAGRMVFSMPELFKWDPSIQTELIDPFGRDRWFAFTTDVDRLNQDFANLRDGYRMLQQNHWSGAMKIDDFLIQAKLMTNATIQLLSAIDVIKETALTTWAYVQERFDEDQTAYTRIRSRLLGLRPLAEDRVTTARSVLLGRLQKSLKSIGR